MPVITTTFEQSSHMEAAILEKGVSGRGWVLASDARIKSEDNALGIGPVVYKGRPKDVSQEYDRDGVPRDGLLMFYDATECVFCLMEAVDPTDLQDTIADYLTNHGGDIPTMAALKPTVG
jgi:hypothetical protein